MTSWRLTKADYAASAFDGEGARLYGGRWNSPGRRVVYAAGSLALAALEILVHIRRRGELQGYVKFRLEFADELMSTVDALPADWRQGRAPDSTRAVGDRWLAAGETPILRVPSVVIPEEWNYLLNPQHPRFCEVEIGPPTPFTFDPRLG